MRLLVVLRVLGILLIAEGLFMLPSVLWSLFDGESAWLGIAYAMGCTLLMGLFVFYATPPLQNVWPQESLAAVVIGWIMVCFVGTLPFLFSNTVSSFTDALFESVSGFTTTGASIFADVESLPHGILLWRSVTHFFGGMGIITFTSLVLPNSALGGTGLLKMESAAMLQDQSRPRLREWLRIILLIYIGFCFLETVLLVFLGLSVFDAINHAFASVATGGFSTKNASIGAFHNVYVEMVAITFMFAGGMNFSVYYMFFRKNFKQALSRDDVRFYFLFTIVSILSIAFINYGNVNDTWTSAIRDSTFTVVSLNTTTGFVTADYEKWPQFCQLLLVLLMLVGACFGSTCGAIKNIRIIVLVKAVVKEIRQMIHPTGVFVVRVNQMSLRDRDITFIGLFVSMYLILFLFISLLLCISGMDIVSALGGTAACMGGVGPGLGLVGPMDNYGGLEGMAKWLFMFAMLLGRLEIFSFFALLLPEFWSRSSMRRTP